MLKLEYNIKFVLETNTTLWLELSTDIKICSHFNFKDCILKFWSTQTYKEIIFTSVKLHYIYTDTHTHLHHFEITQN